MDCLGVERLCKGIWYSSGLIVHTVIQGSIPGITGFAAEMIPFFILHRGKPEIEIFASIFAGLILGIQAWRTNSFIYCFIVHWSVMIFVDVVSVLRYKSGSYGIGLDSFFKLFF